MSGLVERLAEKWAPVLGISTYDEAPTPHKNDARWWLNALCEEMEREWPEKYGRRTTVEEVIQWIRANAGQ